MDLNLYFTRSGSTTAIEGSRFTMCLILYWIQAIIAFSSDFPKDMYAMSASWQVYVNDKDVLRFF